LQELFFKERRRRQAGRPSVPANDPDKMKVLFGTVMALVGTVFCFFRRCSFVLWVDICATAKAQPADIPESMGWWLRQQRDLLAMSADEAGSLSRNPNPKSEP
jgi:hypothetical protein